MAGGEQPAGRERQRLGERRDVGPPVDGDVRVGDEDAARRELVVPGSRRLAAAAHDAVGPVDESEQRVLRRCGRSVLRSREGGELGIEEVVVRRDVLVGADVKPPPREQRHVLPQQLPDDLERRRIGDVELACLDRVGRRQRTCDLELEVGMRLEQRAHVTRHIDLGNDRDLMPSGERDDLTYFALGQRLRGDDLRVGVGLDPPPLVVVQVQMEHVQLQVREPPDLLLDPPRFERIAAEVEHQSADRVARPVARDARRNRRRLVQQLEDRAGRVEGARGAVRGDLRPPREAHSIPLPAELRVVGAQPELDVAPARFDVTRC